MSDYVQRNLHPGETVVYRGRMSWVAALYSGFVSLAFAIVVFVAATIIVATHTGESFYNKLIGAATASHKGHTGLSNTALSSYDKVVGWLPLISVVIFAAAILHLVRGWIFRQTAEYAVTDQRVIGKYGLLLQQSVDIRIAAITGVSTTSPLMGRMFGYGTVWVNSAGGSDYLVNIKDPKAFESAVYSRLTTGTPAGGLDARMAAPVRPGTAPMVAANSRFCSQCGRGLGPGARFCAECGKPVG